MPALTGFKTGLHQSRRRLTRPRQLVLDVINQANRHLTAAQIYERARANYPRLGLATVYRSLDLLVQMGHIQRVHLEQGCHSYAPVEHRHGHHLVCSSCGRTEEFADCDLDLLIHTLKTKTGYAINIHMLELMGQCPSCQVKGRAPKRVREKKRRE